MSVEARLRTMLIDDMADPWDARPKATILDEGERRLWCAVILRALEDARGQTAGAGDRRERHLIRAEARAWFRSREISPGSLRWIVAGLALRANAADIAREVLRERAPVLGHRGAFYHRAGKPCLV